MMREWKGRPVPWVARWTGEVLSVPIQVGTDLQTQTVVAFYEDGPEDRDDRGVLWPREGLTRAGEPQFGEVSVYRQRASMRKRKCQVCGNKIEEKVIRWLLDPRQIIALESTGETVTSSPPTCESCVELSLQLCPAMRKSHAIARVLDYDILGVWGVVVRRNEAGDVEQTTAFVDYRRNDYPFDYRAVIAKQQVVRLNKFVMES